MRYYVLLVLIACGAYAAAAWVSTFAVALWWRYVRSAGAACSPLATARALATARLLPAASGAAAAWALAFAFIRFEPLDTTEAPGPLLLAAAGLMLVLVGAAALPLARAIAASVERRRLMRTGARPAVLGDNQPVWMLDTSYPLAAVVGVIHPRLLLSSRLLRECTSAELDGILRHETAHVHHRDNLVRAAMRYLPNPLSLLPLGARLDRAWAGAVEAAADDAAAGDDEERRAALAGALVKVARMSAAAPRWLPGAAFYEGHGVEGRVRRLISPVARLETPSQAAWLTAAMLGVACAAAAADPVARTLHGWMEAAVRLAS